MTYQPSAEMFWKADAAVEAARKTPGWREFHKTCAAQQLFFDHIEKHGGRYVSVAMAGSGASMKAAEERGKTPIDALVAAYRASGIRVPAAEEFVALMLRPVAAVVDDGDGFDDLLGDDFETLLEG